MSEFKPAFTFKGDHLCTWLTCIQLLNSPILNKGSAFSKEERRTFHLHGLLPPHIETIEDQVARAYEAFKMIDQELERHIYLRQLQDQNETLFYRLVVENLSEMMPVIYTPVVGLACQKFSQIYRRPRGLFVSYPLQDQIEDMLEHVPVEDVKVIVVTDGERILGLGDQGAGGMGIPIGKLSLYSGCGGINPINTLPILLDVGTNNHQLRKEPTYIGWRHERITGDDYYQFVDKFVKAVKKKFPKVLLQFEDFAQPHAYPLLEKYRDELCCFNDDIQGTASVCVGALIAAVKTLDQKLDDQRIAVLGAGSAGCGISEQLVKAMVHEGMSEADARSRFYMVDRNGLLFDDMGGLLPFQQKLAQKRDIVKGWKLKDPNCISLHDVVDNAKPTILLGVSGQPNQFTKEIVQGMHQHVKHPIIFPMSNPTSRCEAIPEDLINWTKGDALVATGSPFDPVEYDGHSYTIAQSNNCYIFPGMGLAVVAADVNRVTDEMFMAASIALSEESPALKTKGASLLPALDTIREVSKKIAYAAAKQAIAEGHAKKMTDKELRSAIDTTMWQPEYHNLKLEK